MKFDVRNDPNANAFIEKMTKYEHLIMALVLLGFVGKVQYWPMASVILIIGVSVLSILYFLKATVKVEPEWSANERFISKLIYLSMVTGLMAFLLNLQSWSGWRPVAMASITLYCVIFGMLLINKLSITKYVTMIELSSLVLVLIYFGKVFLNEL